MTLPGKTPHSEQAALLGRPGTGSRSSSQVVHLPRIHVQAVHDLPQRGQCFQGVPFLERRQLLPVPHQHVSERPVALHQPRLGVVQRPSRHVLHQDCPLSSPSPPIKVRSSTRRFALSSNLGSVPLSAWRTPNRRFSCASASSFSRRATRAPASTTSSGISTRISISSLRPSAVYRRIWNSSISGCSRTMASTA